MSPTRRPRKLFQDIDPTSVRERVAALPTRSWQYKGDASEARHIGPTAQDFGAAFGRGADAKTIGIIDADGVALAAIQGLNAKLEATGAVQAAENAHLRRELAKLSALVESVATPRERGTALPPPVDAS